MSKYCFVSITFKCYASFNLATTAFMEKARQTYFEIKKTIVLDNPCKVIEKNYLYCYEISGLFTKITLVAMLRLSKAEIISENNTVLTYRANFFKSLQIALARVINDFFFMKNPSKSRVFCSSCLSFI